MNKLKHVGALVLAGVVGAVVGGGMSAQNAPGGWAAAGPTQVSLPKDVYPDSRNRLPLAKREDMDDFGKKVFDDLTGTKRLAGTFPAVRLHSPKLAAPLVAVWDYLKYDTGLSDRLLEVAVLTTAREMDCQYEWTQWETHGRDPKDPRHIEPALIDLIKYRKPVVGLGEKETAIIRLGREMFDKKKVSSETFAQVLGLFGRRGTVDLVWLMNNYAASAIEMMVFDQQLLADQAPLLPSRQGH
ncbi:MAG: hypothetical protein ABUS56_00130 [Acidobacteriota bacterium]